MSKLFIGYEAWRASANTWRRGDRFELDGDDLVRHAFVCGGTGVGKTVFAKAMVEEVLLSGTPVIAIDLKGDLASMALHRKLQGEGHLAALLGEDGADELRRFREGLEGEPAVEPVWRAFDDSVDVRLFTPKAPIGRQLAMSALPSFDRRSTDDVDLANQRGLIKALVRGLGSRLWGARALDRHEPELTFIEELVGWANDRGRSLDGLEGLKELGRLVADPPIHEVGGMAIDDYISAQNRIDLRRRIAAQCAGANQDWFTGEPLDVETLIGGAQDGRTPLAVIYLGHIAHFQDQSLAIAQVCASLYRWMRTQGGASGLELMLYIDEVGGASGPTSFFPSNPYQPASKGPLGLLVRQGRAHGLGVLLATQNPMSVDVQALNNIGTWAVGLLNQANEIRRISAALSQLGLGSARLHAELSRIPTHTFMVTSPSMDQPQLVRERWLSSIHTVLTPRQVRAVTQSAVVRRNGQPPPRVDAVPPQTEKPRPLVGRPDQEAGTQLTRHEGDTLPGWWVLSGPGFTRTLADDTLVVVGRSSKCDVVLKDDPYVSGRQLEVEVRNGELFLTPLKVSNLPKVNGNALKWTESYLPTAVEQGLVVTLGRTELEITWRGD